jgi:ATP-dependent Lhr-like helicase
LTRGALSGELVPGGFAGVYPVLKALEESGRARRGYFVEGLGGAQFALPGAVDRMRAAELHSPGGPADGRPMAQVLAAGDPASPFGAALPWPEREADVAHRPGRKAGALVVSVEGEAVLFVEKGGRSILSFTSDAEALGHAAAALVRSVTEGAVGALTVERADGEPVFESPLARALEEAGFRPSSRGLRLRA